MERGRNTTDAYCEVYFGKGEPRKTNTIYNNLEPEWGNLFVFEIADDEKLLENVLEVRVIDEDTFSSDDLIGIVLVDVSSLLERSAGDRFIQGTFPIFDTQYGIRGMLTL
jgi:Ca2+-dependent lipid-binding protein